MEEAHIHALLLHPIPDRVASATEKDVLTEDFITAADIREFTSASSLILYPNPLLSSFLNRLIDTFTGLF